MWAPIDRTPSTGLRNIKMDKPFGYLASNGSHSAEAGDVTSGCGLLNHRLQPILGGHAGIKRQEASNGVACLFNNCWKWRTDATLQPPET